MNKQFNDDEIIQLYQQNNDELPPKAVDDAILGQAFDAVKTEPQTLTSNRKFYYSGMAAALVAVVVFSPWQYFTEPKLALTESADVPALSQAKQALNSGPQVEAMEVLADEAPIEAIEVAGARFEQVAPEQKARKVPAAPAEMYKLTTAKPVSKFDIVIEKIEAQDKSGAEQALIKLLQAEPELHDDVPKSLEALYQALLENGKLAKPEQ